MRRGESVRVPRQQRRRQVDDDPHALRAAEADVAARRSVDGIDVGRDPEAVKRRIGYMSQRFSLYELLTVDQNIRFYAGLYGLDGERLERRRAFALEIGGLAGREHELTRDLAGGWRQRLALGCALLHEPPIVFLDEPTGGVDPVSRREFWRLIDDLSRAGTTVLVTTHYLDEAERCDRVAIMHAGRLAALGTTAELKRRFADRPILEVRATDPVAAMAALDAHAGGREDEPVRHGGPRRAASSADATPDEHRAARSRGARVRQVVERRSCRRSRTSSSTSSIAASGSGAA